ncbi:hypothetical protein [Fibrivirga algicola]|uniref:SD-repeat containing protein B domain-containing protein n=1 Tax=Fibrivirga algicola TaxID=2950420 RepID=A0ABX0QIE5_9BACT|nr:hypothetical protein [Fibrivirga algicola]NID10980.1 hypothetical protein [Fibrivirga algicola]
MTALFRIILICVVALYVPVSVQAQELTVSFWRDTLRVAVGSTFINRLTITNNSSRTANFQILVQTPKSVHWVSSTPQRLSIPAGKHELLLMKGIVYEQPNSVSLKTVVHISDTTGKLLTSGLFKLNVVSTRHKPVLSLYVPDESIILYSATEPARPTLRLVHNELRRQRYTIDVQSIPAAIDRRAFPASIALRSMQDTTMRLLVMPLRYWSVHKPYQLSVTVRDSTGSIVGNVMYKVVVATASKQFERQDMGSGEGYGASAALTKLSNNQWAREARVWGTDSVGAARLSFQLNYLDYASSNFKQLQSSFISLRTNRTLLHVGTLHDYHELPLLGRGAKFSLTRPGHQWTFWGVNVNPNWLYSGENAWTGNIASVRYDQELTRLPGAALSVSSSYFTMPGVSRAGYLNYASFRYRKSDRANLNLLLGQSTEYAQQGPAAARTQGWAGQFDYDYERPTFAWYLHSYVSSPVYAGLHRGANLITSQASWLLENKLSLLVRLNHVYYNQVRYVSPTTYYRYVFGNSVAELNVTKLAGPLLLNLRPYWQQQTDSSNPFSQQANSYRVAPSVTYQQTNKQFMLGYDVGLFSYQTVVATQPGLLSHRIISSASLGHFSLWGYWQQGPYFLNDLRTERPGQIRTASVTPMVNFSVPEQRLTGSAGLNYLYDAHDAQHLQSRFIAVGRVQFDATPTLWVRLEGNGTPYAQENQFAYTQYRMEVVKRFDQLKFKGNNRLQLHFYGDSNGNGRLDPGERWLDGLLVRINDNTLITNEKGTITYKQVPAGTYTVSALSTGQPGDPVLYQEDLVVGRSINKLVPIRKTFRVSGRIQCQLHTYDQKPCEFDRFVIEVRRGDEKLITTSPLPDGTFSVHLSPGPYTILVHDYARQVQATLKTTAIILSQTGEHPPLDWTVDGSTRSVDVKRFGKK